MLLYCNLYRGFGFLLFREVLKGGRLLFIFRAARLFMTEWGGGDNNLGGLFISLNQCRVFHTTKTLYGSYLASLIDTVASLYTKQKAKHSVRKSIPNKAMLLRH